jgi:hypothetical protein
MQKYFLALLLLAFVPCCRASTKGVKVMHNCAIAVRIVNDQNTSSSEADLVNAGKCVGMAEGVMDTLAQWEY